MLDAPPDDVGDDAASRERMLRLFLDGVLRGEGREELALARWAGPIEVTVRGLFEPYLAFVEDLAADLGRLTGLAITVTGGTPYAGDMDVYLAPDPRYWPPNVHSIDPAVTVFTCAAAPGVHEGVIRRATIRINAGLLDPDTVRSCLLEEIVQCLGLFGELDDDPDTILDDRVGYEHLGVVDRLLLRALYDKRLSTGLGRDAARPLVAPILAEGLARLVCRDGEGGRRCGLR